MNWQNLLAHSGTADWIVLVVFHSLWLSLAGLLILYLRRLKAPTTRATWCISLLIVLLSLPAIISFIPRAAIYSQPANKIAIGMNKTDTTPSAVNGITPLSKPTPLMNMLLGMNTPIPKTHYSWWITALNGFGILWMVFTLCGIGRIFYELVFL